MTQVSSGPFADPAAPARAGFRCVLIGTESLLVRCGELLRERGHRIVAVVSDAPTVRSWAESVGAPCLEPEMPWHEQLAGEAVDYLFSVANLRLLSPAMLSIARRGAINFHDGPLPRYAGIAAPVWAILDHAREHGVTWHRMVAEADAGAILKQRIFPIAADEHTVSLNARCYEVGAETFAELVLDLEQDAVHETQATLDPSTRHKAADRPAGRSLLFFAEPADELDALARALDHGTYANPVGVPKLYTDRGLLVVGELEVLGTTAGRAPGTVLAVDASGWRVATATRDVRLAALRTVDGVLVEPAAAAAWAGVSVGDQLPAPPAEALQRVDAVNRRVLRHEAWWVQRLATLAPAPLPALTAGGADAPGAEHALAIPAGVGVSWMTRGGAALGDFLAAAFAAYVARLSGQRVLDLGWRDAVVAEAVTAVEGWFAPMTATHLSVPVDATAESAIDAALAGIADARRHLSYARTVSVRYPTLRKAPLGPLPVGVELVEFRDRRRSEERRGERVSICV